MTDMTARQLGSDTAVCPTCGAGLDVVTTPYGSTHASTCLVCYGEVPAAAPAPEPVPEPVPDATSDSSEES